MPKRRENNPFIPTTDEADLQLKRILTSPDCRITPQQSAFLKYVVNQTLAGKADRIKGYTVATEVFGRRSDFDQNIDPIVSIQAARLRRSLTDYYRGTGRHDPLQIEIPKGSYVPEFSRRQTQPSDLVPPGVKTATVVRNNWPSVFVRPLQNLSDDAEMDFLGIGLATEIAHELNRYPDIRVLTLSSVEPAKMKNEYSMFFMINGSIRTDSNCIKIAIQLTNAQTKRLVWSETHRLQSETTKLITFQERIAKSIAVKIAGQHGHIAKSAASGLNRRLPGDMQVYEAVLRYYEYDLKLNAKAFASALKALETAVAIDPECGQAWGMLAHLFANIFALDIPGFEDPLEKAHALGQNAIRLLPDDQRSRTVMAFIHLLRNDHTAGLAEVEEALRLGPQSLFMLDHIGYLMSLLGEWERGLALIEEVIRLNPFYNNTVHYALWVDYLRHADYEGAYLETMKLNRPALFWDHLARAASLGLLDRIEDGRQSASELHKLKPDFADRGRFLIKNYIKSEPIVEQVIQGLGTVGVKVR